MSQENQRGSCQNSSGSKEFDIITIAYEIGGVLGIDPSPFTIIELITMFNRRVEYDWDINSYLVATMYNCRMGNSKYISPESVNPLKQKQNELTPNEVLEIIKNGK